MAARHDALLINTDMSAYLHQSAKRLESSGFLRQDVATGLIRGERAPLSVLILGSNPFEGWRQEVYEFRNSLVPPSCTFPLYCLRRSSMTKCAFVGTDLVVGSRAPCFRCV
jgi:hypothetical protein